MAVAGSVVESVRVMDEEGGYVHHAWNSSIWYGVRDDRPHLDLLVRGHPLQAVGRTKLERLEDPSPEGTHWQRWNFEEEIARERRFGEMSLPLRSPADSVLRCYVVPSALLGYRHVVAMLEDIEAELGVDATWDVVDTRSERSWSRGAAGGHMTDRELTVHVEEELRLAQSIRREPFSELGPRSRRDVPLPENAIVSHWAARRFGMLRRATERTREERRLLAERRARHAPQPRLLRLDVALEELGKLERRIEILEGALSRLIVDDELLTGLHPGPVFRRDHRLRRLLHAFAPRLSESISITESQRSHYPPVSLNFLWELWGAVWLAREFRRWGFAGSCVVEAPDSPRSCSWRLQRGEVVVELDYEAHPALIDHGTVPPVHERAMPVFEWAALHQPYDLDRPYFGSEEKCSPDYLVRITTPQGRVLAVGDACLASPEHHGVKKPQDAKPYTVEKYRQTVAWVSEAGIVRCHPLGGFVLLPPPSAAWGRLHQMPGVRDCTLLSPDPLVSGTANQRLASLMNAMALGIAEVAPTAGKF